MIENIVIAKLVSLVFFLSSIQIIETFSSTPVKRLFQKEDDFQVRLKIER